MGYLSPDICKAGFLPFSCRLKPLLVRRPLRCSRSKITLNQFILFYSLQTHSANILSSLLFIVFPRAYNTARRITGTQIFVECVQKHQLGVLGLS